MWWALQKAADMEVDSPTGVIRRAIDFYLKEKYNIDYRQEKRGPKR